MPLLALASLLVSLLVLADASGLRSWSSAHGRYVAFPRARESDAQITFTDATIRKAEAAGPLDWVEKGAVTPPTSQGRCATCQDYSAAADVEGAYFTSGHPLTKATPHPPSLPLHTHFCDTHTSRNPSSSSHPSPRGCSVGFLKRLLVSLPSRQDFPLATVAYDVHLYMLSHGHPIFCAIPPAPPHHHSTTTRTARHPMQR